jgi:hypothetical protein
MKRIAFTLASVLSLALCVSIGIAGTVYTTGQFRGIDFGDGAWGTTVGNGNFLPYHNNRIIASLPMNALALPFAVLPLTWAVLAYRRERRRKRVMVGRCVKCGYDLRASTGRCPECGTGTTA